MVVRMCPVCGAPLPPGRRADAIYCGPTCKTRRLWLTRRALLAEALQGRDGALSYG